MNDHPPHDLRLAYIIGTYPLLTTTFIDREIQRLRQWGVTLQVLSIRRPSGPLSPEQRSLQMGVIYLLPVALFAFIRAHLYFALTRPLTYVRTVAYLLTRPHPSMRSRGKTGLHFCLGVYAAHRLRAHAPTHLHAHFVDRAATVAFTASRLLGIQYSITAHANDIYVDPVLLPEKLHAAAFVATCTGYNEEHLAHMELDLMPHQLSCIYHGLDVERYQPNREPSPARNMILAVGQLKEKKGFDYLLLACRQLLDQGYPVVCQIVGEGPQRAQLERQIQQLALGECVTLCGALPHEAVIEKYRQAAIFVLPAVVDAEGGRDGIPNVILEAMAMELPVVSTRHSGIPEAVCHNVNGLLVPPTDAAALAAALEQLLRDPEARQRMGRNGRQIVLEKFELEQNVKRLLVEFTACGPLHPAMEEQASWTASEIT